MSSAADSFVARQLGREPAWRLLPAFIAPTQRASLLAWLALLGEFDEAMFEVSDPRVSQTKLAWWGDDQAAGARAQHPLSRALMADPRLAAVPALRWRELSRAALELATQEGAPASWAEADVRWSPLAETVAVIESALTAVPVPTQEVAKAWQWQRLWRGLLEKRAERSVAPLPLQLALRDGYPAVAFWQALAAERGAWLQATDTPALLHRALLQAVWRRRLKSLCRAVAPAALADPAPLALLWDSWRAAAGSRRRERTLLSHMRK